MLNMWFQMRDKKSCHRVYHVVEETDIDAVIELINS